MAAATDMDWPTFDDPFLDAVMGQVRARSPHLWDRGQLFVEGDSGPGVAEALIVTSTLRPRRAVAMHCEPGRLATLVIRGLGRSDYGRALFTSGRVRVLGSAADLVQAYEDAITLVLRSPEATAFAERVASAWRLGCGENPT